MHCNYEHHLVLYMLLCLLFKCRVNQSLLELFLWTDKDLYVHVYKSSSSTSDIVPLRLFIELMQWGLFYAMLNVVWVKNILFSKQRYFFYFISVQWFSMVAKKKDLQIFFILTALKDNEIMKYSKMLFSKKIKV